MIAVREACDADIAEIIRIAGSAVSSGWTRSYVSERLGRDDTLFLVAYDNGDGTFCQHDNGDGTVCQQADKTYRPHCHLIGFAVFRQVGDDGELLQIAVDESCRRRGAGSLLVNAGLKWARGKALTSVFLEVRASNDAAIALYEKHGFGQVRVRKNYYSNPAEDALVMAGNKL